VAEFMNDQAEGLRRMLAGGGVRAVTVAGGRSGIGKTSVLINLAVALARRGKYVMIIDERSDAGNVAGKLGLAPRYDLIDVINRKRRLEEVMLQGPQGIAIVPAAKGVKALSGMDSAGQEWLLQAFGGLSQPVDVLLVDAGSGSGTNALSMSLASQEVVVVVSNQPASITEAYALIKRMNQEFARRQFRIIVNKSGSEAEALAIYNNMAQAAGRFLDVSLQFMGYIPLDEKLRQAARLCRPVVDEFPTADSARCFRNLAEVVEQWPCSRDDSSRLEGFMQRLIHNSRMAAQDLHF
jgi:flagellar biosynthesis protein FlhG